MNNENLDESVTLHSRDLQLILKNLDLDSNNLAEFVKCLDNSFDGSDFFEQYAKRLYKFVCETCIQEKHFKLLANLVPMKNLNIGDDLLQKLLVILETCDFNNDDMRVLLLKTVGIVDLAQGEELYKRWALYCQQSVNNEERIKHIVQGLEIVTIKVENGIVDEIVFNVLSNLDYTEMEVELIVKYLGLHYDSESGFKVAARLMRFLDNFYKLLYHTKETRIKIESPVILYCYYMLKVVKSLFKAKTCLKNLEEYLFEVLVFANSDVLESLQVVWDYSLEHVEDYLEDIREISVEIIALIPADLFNSEKTVEVFVGKVETFIDDCEHIVPVRDLFKIINGFRGKLDTKHCQIINGRLLTMKDRSWWIKMDKLYEGNTDWFLITREYQCLGTSNIPHQSDHYDRDGYSLYYRNALISLLLCKEFEREFWRLVELALFLVAAQVSEHKDGLLRHDVARYELVAFKTDLDSLIVERYLECKEMFLASIVREFGDTRSLSYVFSVIGRSLAADKIEDLAVQYFNDLEFQYASRIFIGLATGVDNVEFTETRAMLLKKVLELKTRSEISENIGIVAVYSQSLQLFMERSGEQPSQDNAVLLRWIRQFFDSQVAQCSQRDIEILDCLCATIVASHLENAYLQAETLNVNICKFLVDLCLYWFNLIAKGPISNEWTLLLLNTLQFWAILEEACEQDPETWTVVVDFKDRVSEILLKNMMRIGGQGIEYNYLVTKTLKALAEHVEELNHSKLMYILQDNEQRVKYLIDG